MTKAGRPGRLDDKSVRALRGLAHRFGPIRRALLRWFDRHGRAYPWRTTDSWFHLLVAEMMLRRTRADQVLPVYNEFTARFEDAGAAAHLNEADLEEFLQPLGLRWRGRQMAGTLDYVRHNFATHAPTKQTDLRAIPGVGPYSEAMLRNRLFNEPRAAVDANVVRVLLRWEGLPVFSEARREAALWELANRFVRHRRSKDINLALLDFGALVCRPVAPACPTCALLRHCRTGRIHAATDTDVKAKPRRSSGTGPPAATVRKSRPRRNQSKKKRANKGRT